MMAYYYLSILFIMSGRHLEAARPSFHIIPRDLFSNGTELSFANVRSNTYPSGHIGNDVNKRCFISKLENGREGSSSTIKDSVLSHMYDKLIDSSDKSLLHYLKTLSSGERRRQKKFSKRIISNRQKYRKNKIRNFRRILRGPKWLRSKRHPETRNTKNLSKISFSFSDMCFYEEITEVITRLEFVSVPRLIVFKKIIPVYIFEEDVSTESVDVVETLTQFQTYGVSVVQGRSMVPYSLTTYTTIYQTVTKPIEVTLTYVHTNIETEVNYETIKRTETKAKPVIVFETAHQQIMTTVTSYSPSTQLVTVLTPKVIDIAYTQLLTITSCPDPLEDVDPNGILASHANYDHEETSVRSLPFTKESSSELDQKLINGERFRSVRIYGDITTGQNHNSVSGSLSNVKIYPDKIQFQKISTEIVSSKLKALYSNFVTLPPDNLHTRSYSSYREAPADDVQNSYSLGLNNKLIKPTSQWLHSSLENEDYTNYRFPQRHYVESFGKKLRE